MKNSRVIKDIDIYSIHIDRIPLNKITLKYAKQMELGDIFPAIKVAKTKDGFKVLDGRHRVTANKLIGNRIIKAKFSTKLFKED